MAIWGLRFRSIRSRLMATSVAIAVVIFGLVVGQLVHRLSQVQEQSLKVLMEGQSQSNAMAVSKQLEQKMGYTRALARTIEGIPDLPDAEKHAILDSLVRSQAGEEGISAVYVNFEPGKFFGPEFVPGGLRPGVTYFKDGKGKPRAEPTGYQTDIPDSIEWYWSPIKRRKECVVEPYWYAYTPDQGNVLMISMAVPLFRGAEAIGTVGVDIPLAKLQEMVGAIQPIPGSYAILVSNKGARAAHPKPDQLTKPIGDDMTDSARKALLDSIGTGRFATVEKIAKATGKLSRIRYSPVEIGASAQPWSLGLVFPLQEMRAPAERMRREILVSALLGILVLAGGLGWMTGRLLKPLDQAATLMHNMAEGDGDLTRRMESTGLREIDRFGVEFNRFAEATRGMVSKVIDQTKPMNVAAEALLLVAGELDLNSGRVSERATVVGRNAVNMSRDVDSAFSAVEQSGSNLERIAAAIEQMNASIREVAHGASQSRATGMEALDAAEQAGRFVGELANASREIEQVIEIIVEISEQTKLLALNASIEAARAGEAGRGFAVVADEVKELAKGTSEATEDIRSRVDRMRAATENAVERIAQIQAVIRKSSDMQATIAASVEEQSSSTREIAQSLTEVVSGVRTVRKSLGGVVEGAKSVSTDMSEVTGVSGDLRTESLKVRESADRLVRMADGVKALLGRFRV